MLPYEIFDNAALVNGVGVGVGLLIVFYEIAVGRRSVAASETP